MFSKIFDYGSVRDGKNALGFYIVHLVILFGAASILGWLLFSNFYDGYRFGVFVGVLGCVTIGIKILLAKGLQKETLPVMLVLSSAVAAFFLGAFLGLVPIAYISTLDSRKSI